MTRYASAAAFRQALEHRLLNQTRAEPRVPLVRLRKAVVFEALLRRLLNDRPDYWLLKGGFALQLRVGLHARTTKDIDLRSAGSIDEAEWHLRDAAQRDLGDYFAFEIGVGTTELTGAPGGGRRVPVRALLAGRRFEEFQVDLGCGDPVVGSIQTVPGSSIFEALGCPPIALPLYPLATTVAEKLHAYTLPRLNENMRVRDLVDLMLLLDAYEFDAQELHRACAATFEARGTHAWPPSFQPPPSSWDRPYQRLWEETGIHPRTPEEAHEALVAFLGPVLRGTSARWDPDSHTWSSGR